jgi:hypothetical protein
MVEAKITTLAAGAAAATAAAVVAYKLASANGGAAADAASAAYFSLVVFPDANGSPAKGKTLRWPRHGPVGDLIATVSALLVVESPAR